MRISLLDSARRVLSVCPLNWHVLLTGSTRKFLKYSCGWGRPAFLGISPKVSNRSEFRLNMLLPVEMGVEWQNLVEIGQIETRRALFKISPIYQNYSPTPRIGANFNIALDKKLMLSKNLYCRWSITYDC